VYPTLVLLWSCIFYQQTLCCRRLLGTSADRHCCHKHHTTHLHTHKLFLTRRRLLGTSADRHCFHKHNTTHLHTHKLPLSTYSSPPVRELSLLALKELLLHHPLRFPAYSGILLSRLVEACADPVRAVAQAAAECLECLTQVEQPQRLMEVIAPMVGVVVGAAPIHGDWSHLALCVGCFGCWSCGLACVGCWNSSDTWGLEPYCPLCWLRWVLELLRYMGIGAILPFVLLTALGVGAAGLLALGVGTAPIHGNWSHLACMC
jgi:hypothetical protein